MRDSRPPTPMEFPSLNAAVAWMRENNPWASDASLHKDALDKMRQQEDGTWTWKADPKLFNTRLTDLDDPVMIERYWKAIEAIQCPILEVRGTGSTIVSDEAIERMKRVGKQFSSVDVEGSGHLVAVDRPQALIEMTRAFLGVPA